MQTFGTKQSSEEWALSKESFWRCILNRPNQISRLLASLSLVFLLAGLSKVQSQVVINEIAPNTSIELKNIGNTTVDISSYWLCNFPDYVQLSDFNVLCGSLNMAPGALVTVELEASLGLPVPGNDGELGLYVNAAFGSAASIRDYVEWGSSGHGRSGVAVAAGIWNTGDFVAAFNANESIEYSGSGNSATSWAVTANPTSNCMENSNAGNTCDVFVNNINLTDGSSSTSICVDGVGDPLDVETNGGTADASRGWIITDDVGNILAIPAAPPFDLDGAGVGVCQIWYIRYEDNDEFGGNIVGNNLTDLTGCFALSNPIEVIREAPDGGMVSLTNGETTYTGTAGNIVFNVQHTTSAPNLSYWYIITDDNDNILGFMNSANGNTLDLSVAPPGECHIWGWSYRGLPNPVIGDNISTLTDDACEDISDNFIRVIREDAGDCDVFVNDINLPGGATSTSICVDGVGDPLDVETNGGTADASRGWIITDDAGNILALPAASPFDLDGAGVGVCQIWYIRYLDNGEFGGNVVGNNLTDLTGCFALSNPIEVVREAPDGGMVSLTNGQTTYFGTAGDIVFNVQHTTSAPNLSYWYIITDDNDNILGFMNSANGNTLDLSMAPPGECHIWGWSYRGLPNPVIGDNISTLTDDACEDISDNFIRVIRQDGNDCDVFVNDIVLTNGETTATICVDGNPDPLRVTANGGTRRARRAWIITDDAANILALPEGPPFDLDGAGVGVCQIWYVRYLDNGEFGGNVVGNNLADLTGCFAISNPITVIREAPDGGSVYLANGETTYTGTAGNIVFDVQHTTNAPNLSYWYIITDDNDNILGFMNSANGNTLDLSVAPPGECHIWGWSYRGLPNPVIGDNISTLTDDACEDISDNFIRIIREAPECDVYVGDINLPGGATSTSICVDGVGDPLYVETSGGSANASRGWIITDDAGNILALPAAPPFDLDGAGPGVCQIWYIRYLDNGQFGGNVVGNNLTDLTGCYALANPIEVIREAPDGGSVYLANGETTYTGTAGNIVFDVQHTTNAPNLSYWYIITDDNDNILGFMNSANGNTLDLSVAPPGECHIWGWSYRGLPNPVIGDNISILTDDACEDISDNFIRIIREAPKCDVYVGDINLPGGATSTSICVDGVGDPLYVETSGGTANASRGWIITDDAGNILALPAAPPFDLDGAGPGVCQIWYIRYLDNGQFGGNVVGNNLTDLTGCYALANPIEVIREAPDGGRVYLANGGTTYTGTAGDIVFDVQHTTNAPNLSYWYIITDDNDDILGFMNSANGNTLDLSVAPPGECHIWGWSYRGLPNPVIGDNISTLTDDACEDISDNFIRIIREAPECDIYVGDINLPGGATSTSICVDGVGDPLYVETSGGTANASRGWIITDDAGNILALPAAPPFDLDGAGPGVCQIWYIRYLDNGEFGGNVVGNNLTDLTGCYALANPIEVIREAPDGGSVYLANGGTTYTGTAGDIVFRVRHTTNAPNLSYWYIITDDNDDILGFMNSANGNTLDLSVAPPGECHIWGWSYRGLPNPVIGESIYTLTDDACEDISDNFIRVIREAEVDDCVAPEEIEVESVSRNKARLDWEDISSAFIYYVRFRAEGANTWRYRFTFSSRITLNRLSSHTTYEVQVLSFCTGGEFSEWSETVYFTTSGSNHALINVQDDSAQSDNASLFMTKEEHMENLERAGIAISSKELELEFAAASLNLYPNPVQSELSVETNLEGEELTVRIFSITGKLVKQLQIASDQLQSIAVDELNPGMYIFNIQNGEEQVSKNFIKQ